MVDLLLVARSLAWLDDHFAGRHAKHVLCYYMVLIDADK
jgi:hypothetical protein